MTEETTRQDDTDAKGEQLIRCPCCGKLTLPKPLNPSSDLVDQWLACMLSATPFRHEYKIYNGRMRITATQLSASDIDAIQDLIGTLQVIKDMDWSSEELGGSCPVAIDQMMNAARLYVSILVISIKSEGTEKTYKPAAIVKTVEGMIKDKDKDIRAYAKHDEWVPVLKECEKLLLGHENVSAVPQPMIMGVAEAHNRLSRILMDTGFDDAFWEGIELA